MVDNPKPSWETAPEWARYVAQDDDGAWYWYEYKPEWNPGTETWLNTNGGNYLKVVTSPAARTLERRPD